MTGQDFPHGRTLFPALGGGEPAAIREALLPFAMRVNLALSIADLLLALKPRLDQRQIDGFAGMCKLHLTLRRATSPIAGA